MHEVARCSRSSASGPFLQTMLTAVGALLPIVDPLGSAPVYLQVTTDVEAQSRSALARLVAIHCFLLVGQNRSSGV